MDYTIFQDRIRPFSSQYNVYTARDLVGIKDYTNIIKNSKFLTKSIVAEDVLGYCKKNDIDLNIYRYFYTMPATDDMFDKLNLEWYLILNHMPITYYEDPNVVDARIDFNGIQNRLGSYLIKDGKILKTNNGKEDGEINEKYGIPVFDNGSNTIPILPLDDEIDKIYNTDSLTVDEKTKKDKAWIDEYLRYHPNIKRYEALDKSIPLVDILNIFPTNIKVLYKNHLRLNREYESDMDWYIENIPHSMRDYPSDSKLRIINFLINQYEKELKLEDHLIDIIDSVRSNKVLTDSFKLATLKYAMSMLVDTFGKYTQDYLIHNNSVLNIFDKELNRSNFYNDIDLIPSGYIHHDHITRPRPSSDIRRYNENVLNYIKENNTPIRKFLAKLYINEYGYFNTDTNDIGYVDKTNTIQAIDNLVLPDELNNYNDEFTKSTEFVNKIINDLNSGVPRFNKDYNFHKNDINIPNDKLFLVIRSILIKYVGDNKYLNDVINRVEVLYNNVNNTQPISELEKEDNYDTFEYCYRLMELLNYYKDNKNTIDTKVFTDIINILGDKLNEKDSYSIFYKLIDEVRDDIVSPIMFDSPETVSDILIREKDYFFKYKVAIIHHQLYIFCINTGKDNDIFSLRLFEPKIDRAKVLHNVDSVPENALVINYDNNLNYSPNDNVVKLVNYENYIRVITGNNLESTLVDYIQNKYTDNNILDLFIEDNKLKPDVIVSFFRNIFINNIIYTKGDYDYTMKIWDMEGPIANDKNGDIIYTYKGMTLDEWLESYITKPHTPKTHYDNIFLFNKLTKGRVKHLLPNMKDTIPLKDNWIKDDERQIIDKLIQVDYDLLMTWHKISHQINYRFKLSDSEEMTITNQELIHTNNDILSPETNKFIKFTVYNFRRNPYDIYICDILYTGNVIKEREHHWDYIYIPIVDLYKFFVKHNLIDDIEKGVLKYV